MSRDKLAGIRVMPPAFLDDEFDNGPHFPIPTEGKRLVDDTIDDMLNLKFSASISMTLSYRNRDALLLTELRKYEIASPGERVNTISVHHRFTAAVDAVINEVTYGGFTYRPSPEMMR